MADIHAYQYTLNHLDVFTNVFHTWRTALLSPPLSPCPFSSSCARDLTCAWIEDVPGILQNYNSGRFPPHLANGQWEWYGLVACIVMGMPGTLMHAIDPKIQHGP